MAPTRITRNTKIGASAPESGHPGGYDNSSQVGISQYIFSAFPVQLPSYPTRVAQPVVFHHEFGVVVTADAREPLSRQARESIVAVPSNATRLLVALYENRDVIASPHGDIHGGWHAPHGSGRRRGDMERDARRAQGALGCSRDLISGTRRP